MSKDLEPLDYLANKLATGVFPGGVKHMFSSEDWLAFKDGVRMLQQMRDTQKREALLKAVQDVSQQQRHWSDNRADWCGRGNLAVSTTCICDQLNERNAELRQAITEIYGEVTE
jgi:hypothetical protein